MRPNRRRDLGFYNVPPTRVPPHQNAQASTRGGFSGSGEGQGLLVGQTCDEGGALPGEVAASLDMTRGRQQHATAPRYTGIVIKRIPRIHVAVTTMACL